MISGGNEVKLFRGNCCHLPSITPIWGFKMCSPFSKFKYFLSKTIKHNAKIQKVISITVEITRKYVFNAFEIIHIWVNFERSELWIWTHNCPSFFYFAYEVKTVQRLKTENALFQKKILIDSVLGKTRSKSFPKKRLIEFFKNKNKIGFRWNFSYAKRMVILILKWWNVNTLGLVHCPGKQIHGQSQQWKH